MSGALRLDAALVARGLSVSRTAARKAIEAGRVSVRRTGHPDFSTVLKPAFELFGSDEIRMDSAEEDRWVSRGALKLLGALAATGINPEGCLALDIGQSTGGFTDVLLHYGAGHVIGVDVGHGQLHTRLQSDCRVICIEGCNARELSRSRLLDRLTDLQVSNPASHASIDAATSRATTRGFDLIVADVSFISLLKVCAGFKTLMAPGANGLWLVKPQFEVGPALIGKGGIVKPEALGPGFETSICDGLRAQGYVVRQFLPSPIQGGDGNREFFVWVTPES